MRYIFGVDEIIEPGILCGRNFTDVDIPAGTTFTTLRRFRGVRAGNTYRSEDLGVIGRIDLTIVRVHFYNVVLDVVPGAHSAGIEFSGEGLDLIAASLAALSKGESLTIESEGDWPFDQPPNCAAFTTRRVVDGSEPIVLVSHDLDDHGWQFLGPSGPSMADAQVILLKNIVQLDPSVLEVADLPPGWQAIREKIGKPWLRRLHPDHSADK